jgi:hypothetical protein
VRPSRIAITVLVVAGTAGFGLRACTNASNGTSHPVPHSRARAAPGSPFGPTRRVHDVPQGWRHDPAGARAAAIAYVALTGTIAHAGPIARHDMVTQLATDRYGPILAELTDQQISELLDSLGQADIDPTQLVWLETPLTARNQTTTAAGTVRVEVWSVLILGAPDTGPPRQAWRTVTVTLAWEHDDWKVDAWTARAGPTPGLAPETAISDLTRVTGPAGWPTALRKDNS